MSLEELNRIFIDTPDKRSFDRWRWDDSKPLRHPCVFGEEAHAS
jgi:hypothetical protein